MGYETPFSRSQSTLANEMNLIFKVSEVKKLMGLKVHQDGLKPANSLTTPNKIPSING
jgi:hypothetical protein